ncbi:hypothetical protein [Streptomyces zaomyceticus]|uniref:hypothetical protein n=1 Tax=Streptomyces zaomyceticus TaxID=68286 RepID=UPI0034185AB6
MTTEDAKRDGADTERAAEKAVGGVRLVENLVARVPGFVDAYECHVFNEPRVLPHLFFWDVVQDTVASYLGEGGPEGPDWWQVLTFLEEETQRCAPGGIEVIVTSFLNDLPYPGEAGYGIEAHLGPALKNRYLQLRPWYSAKDSGLTGEPLA